MIKKLPNCKDNSESLKTFNITYEYETIRGNTKREIIKTKGTDEGSAGANFLLWLVVTNNIKKNHIKKKNINLIEIKENSTQLNPL